jgi:hypothetical protein
MTGNGSIDGMQAGPFQVLQGAQRERPARAPAQRLVIAGATGVLGNEVLRRVAGQFESTCVLAREAITPGLRSVTAKVMPAGSPAEWPLQPADAGIILFEPPRLLHDRERALWTPLPDQLAAVAGWMRRSGIETLAVVLPHAQGRLPEALKRGLAGLDEHEVATLGFDRVLFVRSAQKPGAPAASGGLARLAHWMLSVLSYMVPSSEQPVRAAKVAEFVAHALQQAPAGIHIAAPELVWRAAQGDVRSAVQQWLRG